MWPFAWFAVGISGSRFPQTWNQRCQWARAALAWRQCQEGVPTHRQAHRHTRRKLVPLCDLSMNFLRDAKISQEAKGQHSCWSQAKIRFNQSLEEHFSPLSYLSKILIIAFCVVENWLSQCLVSRHGSVLLHSSDDLLEAMFTFPL